MAEYAVTSAFAYLGALDLSDQMTDWSMTGSGDPLDKTTMRNNGGARRFKMGLITTQATVGGFTDMDTKDAILMAGFQARSTKAFAAGNVETEGQPCCVMQIVKPQLQQHAGQVGELAKDSVQVQSTDKYGGVRGRLLVKATSVSTTGAKGTAVQLGATSSTQHLFAGFFLLGTAGTSITAVLESDNASNFPSATTQVTFGPLTAAGGTWATPVAGAINDDWYRLRVTSITGTWTIACIAAIE